MDDEQTDAFNQALLDFAAGRTGTADGLNDEECELLAAIQDWLPGLSDAIAVLAVTNNAHPVTPVRHDDPIALMLGLVADPAVTLNGRRLASLRKAAGYNIGDLAQRLATRGWDVSVKTVSAWERNLLNPPPATINAIAEELSVTPDAIISPAPARATQTLEDLFTDATITAFFEEWATEANVPVETITERSKRLLVSAGKRNATSVTPETLLAVLRHFRTSPAFEVHG